MTRYDTEHRHTGIRFVTPQQRHEGKEPSWRLVLPSTTAKEASPHRWKGRDVSNWKPIGAVWLNPDNHAELPFEIVRAAA